MHNIHYLHKHMVRHDDLTIKKHKPSISLLKELIEVSGIFIIGSFSIKILFHETAPLFLVNLFDYMISNFNNRVIFICFKCFIESINIYSVFYLMLICLHETKSLRFGFPLPICIQFRKKTLQLQLSLYHQEIWQVELFLNYLANNLYKL